MRLLSWVRAVAPATVNRISSSAHTVGAFVLLGGVWISDVLDWISLKRNPANPDGPPPSAFEVLPVVSGAIVAAIVVALLKLRSGPKATAAGAALAVAIPIVASAGLAPLPTGEFIGYPFSGAEAAGILLALTVVAYRCSLLPVVGVAVIALSALLSDGLRFPDISGASEGMFSNSVLAVVIGLAPGSYMRWRDEQRHSQVARARQEERLSVAHDLHDEVAHKITGVVVQTQALRHIADEAPERAQSALPEIEKSATQALASMRRLVETLRLADGAPLTDGRGLTEALLSLEQVSAPGIPRVDVNVTGRVDNLPADVSAAVARIGQEAVTNAQRHARDATVVTVNAAAGAGRASIEVRDNGRGGASSFSSGGGHGLVGMAERARLLGGEATAGPARFGPGWRVRAELPVSGLSTSESSQ